MKNYHISCIRIPKFIGFLILMSIGIWSCTKEFTLSIQNCYGGVVNVYIEGLSPKKNSIESANYPERNNTVVKLTYPEKKIVGQTTFKEIKTGLLFNKMIIIRGNDTIIINKGDNILPFMLTDVIGEVAVPFCICI